MYFSFKLLGMIFTRFSPDIFSKQTDTTPKSKAQHESIPPSWDIGGSIECLEPGGYLDLLGGIDQSVHGPGGPSDGRPRCEDEASKWSGYGGSEQL